MTTLPLENHYALLACLLAPKYDDATIASVRAAIQGNQIVWVQLLHQAGVERCTPLLCVRLKQNPLFGELPPAVQTMLQHAYDLNLARNALFKSNLSRLLTEFKKANIESLLLKGAATFCDDLYGDPGARVMGDIDVLVQPSELGQCQGILDALGYCEVADPNRTLDGLATDERHHHLLPHTHPGNALPVEIHFKTAYAQAGRVLSTAPAWGRRRKKNCDGYETSILSPQDRLTLNTVHALLPHREFIRGRIELLQLAEFALIATEFAGEIDWGGWLKLGQRHRLTREFLTYLNLAHTLMHIPWPASVQHSRIAQLHTKRVLNVKSSQQAAMSRKPKIGNLVREIYYYANLPAWLWKNVCYAPGLSNMPDRVHLLVKKLLSGRSWSKL